MGNDLMTKIGIFLESICLGMLGNLLLVTVEGPPDKIIPFTKLKSKSLFICLIVKISDRTPRSLILRAMSFVTCEPKSMIIILSLKFCRNIYSFKELSISDFSCLLLMQYVLQKESNS